MRCCRAADAATAPNPNPSQPAAAPRSEPSVSRVARADPGNKIQSTQAGVKAGSRNFVQATMAPVKRASGILWLEVTGTLFPRSSPLPERSKSTAFHAALRTRGPDHRNLLLAAAIFLFFRLLHHLQLRPRLAQEPQQLTEASRDLRATPSRGSCRSVVTGDTFETDNLLVERPWLRAEGPPLYQPGAIAPGFRQGTPSEGCRPDLWTARAPKTCTLVPMGHALQPLPPSDRLQLCTPRPTQVASFLTALHDLHRFAPERKRSNFSNTRGQSRTGRDPCTAKDSTSKSARGLPLPSFK